MYSGGSGEGPPLFLGQTEGAKKIWDRAFAPPPLCEGLDPPPMWHFITVWGFWWQLGISDKMKLHEDFRGQKKL